MNLNTNYSVANKNLSFGRALTSKEKEQYKSLVKEARQELGLNTTAMICFDVSCPSPEGKNTGTGSTFSKKSEDFFEFMNAMAGVNTIQVGPQGIITQGNTSPFSGSVFAIGEHVIDLEKLTTDKFENILGQNDYEQALIQDKTAETRTNYEHVLGGAQKTALKAAYENFKTLPADSPLKTEYSQFEKENTDWLQKDALYEALSEENGNNYWGNWNNDLDKYLFSGRYSEQEVNARTSEIEENHEETIGFHKFSQFIADKQQQETKQTLNDKDMKIFGDCLVGFSPRENWAFMSAFGKDSYYGCQSDDGPVRWGLPAIDTEKIGEPDNLGEAGKLLKKKFDSFFRKYDGARIDAAWQLIQPYIYEEPSGNKKEGIWLGDKILKIMDASAKEIHGDKYSSENLALELLGGMSHKDGLIKGRTQIHHSIYQQIGWKSTNVHENEIGNEKLKKLLVDKKILKKDEDLHKILKDLFLARKIDAAARKTFGEHYNIEECNLQDIKQHLEPEYHQIADKKDWTKYLLDLSTGWGSVNFYKNEGLSENEMIFGLGTHDDESLEQVAEQKYDEQMHVLEKNLKLGINNKIDFMKAKFAEVFTTRNNFFTVFDAMGINKRFNDQDVNPENWRARIGSDYEKTYFSNLAKGKGLNAADAMLKAMKAKGINNPKLEAKLKKFVTILSENGPMTRAEADKEFGADYSELV